MLENPNDSSSAATSVKRYAPPHHKNRGLNRRNSAERFDRTNNFGGSDVEKNHVVAPRNISSIGHGEAGSSNNLNENARPGLIALDGCRNSEAFQFLNNRWAAAMHNYSSPSIDLSERPVMYSGSSASAWGNFRLPHQIMPPPSPSIGVAPSQMDLSGQSRTRNQYTPPH